MEIDRINEIFKYGALKPLKKITDASEFPDFTIIGFDSEFDSVTGELLTIQLFTDGWSLYHVVKDGLSFEQLRALIPFENPFLVAFFAIAELSHISDWFRADVRPCGSGLFHARYADLTIFDIKVFWSSARYFSLKDLGKLVNLPKLDYDRANISRADVDLPEFKAYAMRDAEICFLAYNLLRSSVQRLFDADLLNFQSAPSLSSYVYRRGLSGDLPAPDESFRRFALACYWGGRSENFHHGEFSGNIIEVDAVSMYPASAIAIGGFPEAGDWRFDRNCHPGDIGFCHSLFKNRFMPFNSLPVFYDGLLYWPKSGESFSTTFELGRNDVCGLNYMVASNLRHKWLVDYLKLLLDQKEKATGTDREVYKLMLNSLIGKLAQNRETNHSLCNIREAEYLGVPVSYIPLHRRRNHIQLGSCFYPEFASLILGYARFALHAAACYLHKKGNKILLCSTDSLVYIGCPEDFTLNGITFKVKAVGDRIKIWKEKVYAIYKNDDIIKEAHHGLPPNSVKDLNIKQRRLTIESKQVVKVSGAERNEKFGSFKAVKKTTNLSKRNKIL